MEEGTTDVLPNVGKNYINMTDLGANICSRCGRERIVVKTIKEVIGNSTVITRLTSCPDRSCQAIINVELAKEQKFRDDMKVASDRRIAEAKARKAENSL